MNITLFVKDVAIFFIKEGRSVEWIHFFVNFDYFCVEIIFWYFAEMIFCKFHLRILRKSFFTCGCIFFW